MDDSPLRERSTGVTDRDLCDGSPSAALERQPFPGNFYARMASQLDSYRTGVVNHDSYPTFMPSGDGNPILGDINFASNEAANFSNLYGDVGNTIEDVEPFLIDPRLSPNHFGHDGMMDPSQEPPSTRFFAVDDPIHAYEQNGYTPQSVTATQDSSALFTFPPVVIPEAGNMFGAPTTVPGQQDMFYNGTQGSIGMPITQSDPPNIQSTAANQQASLDHVVQSGPPPKNDQTAATRLPPLTAGRVLVVQWENFVSTAERLTATVRHSMETLKTQVNQSLMVHEHCIMHYNQTGIQRWRPYIEELQFQYSLIRDYQCVSLRAALHTLQQWLRQYKHYLPQDNVRRSIGIMQQYPAVKAEIDEFRFPLWENMAVERMVLNMGNTGNAV